MILAISEEVTNIALLINYRHKLNIKENHGIDISKKCKVYDEFVCSCTCPCMYMCVC